MAEQVVKSVAEELSCSICMNRFRVPKMLDCIHSFCQRCLEDYVKKLDGKELTCPMCRKTCVLPAGVMGLQTNIYLVNLCEKIDLYEKLKPSKVVSKLCESCKKNPKVSAFCVDCNYAICKNCEEQHSLFPALQSHSIQQIGNFDPNKLQNVRKSVMAPSCDLHAPEKLRFYCNTCSKLVCRECTVVQHPKPNHICVEAPSQFEKVKRILSKFLKESPVQLQVVSKYMSDAKSGENGMKRESKALLKEMKDRLEKVKLEIQSQLNNQFKEASEILQKNHASKQYYIDESVELAASWIKRMESTRVTTQKVIQENNMWELLGLSNNLIGSFNALRDDNSEFEWDISELKLEMVFTPSGMPSIQFGECFSTNDLHLPIVIWDPQSGTFIRCSFDRQKSIIEITRHMYNDGGYIEQEYHPIYLQLKVPDGRFKLSACSNGSYIILAVHKWLVVISNNSNSFYTSFTFKDKASITSLCVFQSGLFIVLDSNPTTIYHAQSFNSYCTHRQQTVKETVLDLELVSRNYQGPLTPYETSQDITHILTSNRGSILLINDNSKLVQYDLNSKIEYIVNVKKPPGIPQKTEMVAILNICSSPYGGGGTNVMVTINGYEQYLEDLTFFILWGEQKRAKGASIETDKGYFITKTNSLVYRTTGIWKISPDMGLPIACRLKQGYNHEHGELTMCNSSGDVFTLSHMPT